MKETGIERIVEHLSGRGEDLPETAGDSQSEATRWKELDRIAGMMQAEPVIETPAGLDERVMARVRAQRTSWWRVVGRVLLQPRTVSFDPLRALRSPISGQECSFYFIMVGVFYAILSIVLMMGFGELGTTLAAPGWVRWQPQIALITAGCMVAIGLYLLKDGKTALRMARIGALVYLGFALLNGIIVSLKWDIPVSAYVSLLSAIIGLPTGLFLIRTIQNCGKRYA
jgi:hypothetical protein